MLYMNFKGRLFVPSATRDSRQGNIWSHICEEFIQTLIPLRTNTNALTVENAILEMILWRVIFDKYTRENGPLAANFVQKHLP